jgi:biopolymer transport protein ExbD
VSSVAADGGHSRKRGDAPQDIELNIASIIDCFVVLITYLLISASFISLGVLDVSVATPVPPTNSSAAGASDSLTIELAKDKGVQVSISGKSSAQFSIPPKDGSLDFERLQQQLAEVKQKWPDLQSALVTADNTAEYKELVKVIETARSAVPSVSLGEKE